MAPTKTRQELKAKFVRNAIPSEQDFKDLIDAPLIQSDDGVFRNSGEPLSIVSAIDSQERVLQFFGDPISSGRGPEWLISLNPGTDPSDATTNRRGFGITHSAGKARLHLDPSGNLGIGTNNPQAKLHIAGGGARIDGDLMIVGSTTFMAAIKAIGPVELGKDDGSVDVVMKGAVRAARSDLYFTKTDHIHTGIGNASGFAAIENSASPYDALMILGRSTPGGRMIKMWDKVEVNGRLSVSDSLKVSGNIESRDIQCRQLVAGGNNGGWLAYLGGDDFGVDVQIGSLNPAVKVVALFNPGNGDIANPDRNKNFFMDLFCNDITCRDIKSSNSIACTIITSQNITSPNPVKVTSDLSLKTNVRTLTKGLLIVDRLRPVSFTWAGDLNSHSQKDASPMENLGLIAQEVAEVLPEIVSVNHGTLAIAYTSLIPVLLRAVQELHSRVLLLERGNATPAALGH